MTSDNIEQLAIALANAKDVESNAKIARIEAEEALANAIGGKDNGTTTVKVGRFTISVKRGWNYKIDMPKDFAKKYPDFVKITEKIEICSKVYEEQREKNTSIFAEMAEHVTATPKKTAVELKL